MSYSQEAHRILTNLWSLQSLSLFLIFSPSLILFLRRVVPCQTVLSLGPCSATDWLDMQIWALCQTCLTSLFRSVTFGWWCLPHWPMTSELSGFIWKAPSVGSNNPGPSPPQGQCMLCAGYGSHCLMEGGAQISPLVKPWPFPIHRE